MPKVSVVVPVYNVERYLRQCVDSLLRQTLDDIEIILINDGSTDKSGCICDEYALKDKRIRVIHKTNEGLSVARNDGIDISTAPYIMFVDSDDWVEPEFCEIPYNIAMKSKAEIVLFLYNAVKNHDKKISIKAHLHEGLLRQEEAFFFNVNVTPAAWIGLYQKDLFSNVRYPNGKYFEDVGTTHRLINMAKSVYFISTTLYNRRIQRPGSITTATTTKNHPDKREMIIRRIDDFYSWGYKDFAQKYVLSILAMYGRKTENQKKYVDIAKKMEYKKTTAFMLKHILLLQLFRISPVLFDVLCIITGKRVRYSNYECMKKRSLERNIL